MTVTCNVRRARRAAVPDEHCYVVDEGTPRLICNPSDDVAFVALVERLGGSIEDPRRLERGLRIEYPLAVVRRSVLSAEPYPAWYVYRDGRWTTGAERVSFAETTRTTTRARTR
jgi:hypothetical protein